MSVSVVIVTYNSEKYIKDCLESLLPQNPSEVIVVDNASKDKTVEIIKEQFFSDENRSSKIKLIESPENLGFGKGQNIGLRASKEEILLLLSPDVLLKEGVLEELEKYLKENPQVALIGPKILNPDGNSSLSAYFSFPSFWSNFWDYSFVLKRFFERLEKFFKFKFSFFSTLKSEKPISVAHFLGAVTMARKTAFQEVDFFDEAFFLFREETDLCRRLINRGWEIHYHPKVEAVHVGGGSQSGHLMFTSNFYLQSNLFYFQRYFPGRLTVFRLALSSLLGSLISLIGLIFILPFSIIKPRFFKLVLIYIGDFLDVFKWWVKKLKIKDQPVHDKVEDEVGKMKNIY